MDQVDGAVSSTGTGVVREQHESCHPQQHWCLTAPEEVPVTKEDPGGTVAGSVSFFGLLFQMTTLSSSLNTVMKTTVTLYFLYSTYVVSLFL